MKLSRRQFFGIGAGLFLGSSVGALGTALREPHETNVKSLEIRLKRLPPAFENFRIAQLSDIHFNSFMEPSRLERVVELVNEQKPDCVLLTGDFVTASFAAHERVARAQHAWPCAEILQKLRAPFGSFAVLGNHDYETDVRIVTEALSTRGQMRVLRNQAAAVERDGARIWISGLDNVSKRRSRPELAFQGIPANECTIVAVHEPDIADEIQKCSVDLQLSGHSHGGQIRFPIVGPLYLPQWAQKYPLGHYQLGDLQLYTNPGVGVIGLPMRFMCPPEITVFTLRHDESYTGK